MHCKLICKVDALICGWKKFNIGPVLQVNVVGGLVHSKVSGKKMIKYLQN